MRWSANLCAELLQTWRSCRHSQSVHWRIYCQHLSANLHKCGYDSGMPQAYLFLAGKMRIHKLRCANAFSSRHSGMARNTQNTSAVQISNATLDFWAQLLILCKQICHICKTKIITSSTMSVRSCCSGSRDFSMEGRCFLASPSLVVLDEWSIILMQGFRINLKDSRRKQCEDQMCDPDPFDAISLAIPNSRKEATTIHWLGLHA